MQNFATSADQSQWHESLLGGMEHQSAGFPGALYRRRYIRTETGPLSVDFHRKAFGKFSAAGGDEVYFRMPNKMDAESV